MSELQILRDALIELKMASIQIVDEKSLKATMKKYDCIFMEENFNIINSLELLHTLKLCFNLELTQEQLLKYLPIVCESLNMKLEGLQQLENPGKIVAYLITLH